MAGYKTSPFFEVSKWLFMERYLFFRRPEFAKDLFQDLVVYKTSLKFLETHTLKKVFLQIWLATRPLFIFEAKIWLL